ncbi:MAG: ABC transporter ATP-binding protein, partial [Acidiferrobacterales bacterium]
LVGLIGPNGSGKTTLLRVLLNLQSVVSGHVRLDDQDLHAINRRAIARRVAYLPQGGDCHWPLTVERLVALGRLPHRAPWRALSHDDESAIARAMASADVEYLAQRVVTTLSGGERTRAHLARALAGEPQILLTDEPVASLDPYHQLQVMELLRAVARQGGAVVVVLHDLTLAARFCDRLVLLHQGSVVAEGQPKDVLTEDNLLATYRIEALRGSRSGEDYVLPWVTRSDSAYRSPTDVD